MNVFIFFSRPVTTLALDGTADDHDHHRAHYYYDGSDYNDDPSDDHDCSRSEGIFCVREACTAQTVGPVAEGGAGRKCC